jgi:phage shock protein A
MTIITRLLAVFKGIMHGVLDQVENKQLVLQQCFRDMEAALAQKETRLKQLHACREQIRHEDSEFAHEIEALESDTQTAIEQGKDELARGILRRIQALVRHREILNSDLHAMDSTVAQVQESLSDQKLRYQQICLQAETSMRRMHHAHLAHASLPMFQVHYRGLSDEQIELELLQHKEALKAGTK